MKTKLKCLAAGTITYMATLGLFSQGYVVPNGVVYDGIFQNGRGYGISVMHDPTNGYYTGFALNPVGKTPPGSTYTNTYQFSPIIDVSVRVFLVSSGDPISQQAIQSGSYTELMFDDYVFNNNVPFYLGLYTGNQSFYPQDGIYSDPLFGWALLVNNRGVIEMLDSALEYKGGGIYAGTQNIIPIPEPGSATLLAIGALLLGAYRRRTGEG